LLDWQVVGDKNYGWIARGAKDCVTEDVRRKAQSAKERTKR